MRCCKRQFFLTLKICIKKIIYETFGDGDQGLVKSFFSVFKFCIQILFLNFLLIGQV
jgi:hypothetical protein